MGGSGNHMQMAVPIYGRVGGMKAMEPRLYLAEIHGVLHIEQGLGL